MGDLSSASTLAAGLAQVLLAQGRIAEAAATAEESRDHASPDSPLLFIGVLYHPGS